MKIIPKVYLFSIFAILFSVIYQSESITNLGLFLPLEWKSLKTQDDLDYWIAIAIGAIYAFELITTQNKTANITDAFNIFRTDCVDNLDLNLTLYNDEGSPSIAAEIFDKANYHGDKSTVPIDAIIGPAYSGVSEIMSIIAGLGPVPISSYSATSPLLNDRKGSISSFTRTIPSDIITTTGICAFFSNNKITNAGVLYMDGSYGTGLRDYLVRNCKGTTELQPISFLENDGTSIRTAISTLNDLMLNIIIIIGYDADLKYLIPNLEKFSLLEAGRLIIFTDGLTNTGLYSGYLQGSYSEETLNKILDHSLRIQPTAINNSPAYKQFEEWWLSVDEDDLEFLNKYLNQLNSSYNEYLSSSEDSGKLKMQIDSTHDIFKNLDKVNEYVGYGFDSVLSVSRGFCLTQNLTQEEASEENYGKVVYNKIVNDAFIGISGKIELNNETGSQDPKTSRIVGTVQNIDAGSIKSKIAMVYENNIWVTSYPNLAALPVIPPAVRFFESKNYLKRDLKIASIVLSSLLLTFIFSLMCWTWINKRSRIVARSQPTMILLFLIGTAFCAISTMFAGNESLNPDEYNQSFMDFSCMAFYWFWTIGVSLSFGALIAKLYRIFRIFNNKALRKIKITNSDLYLMVFGIISVDLVILLIWQTFSPAKFRRITSEVDLYGNPLVSYGECESKHSASFQITIIVYQMILFCGGVIASYKTRKVDSEYQESKFIAFSLVSQFQLYIIGFPLIFVFASTAASERFFVIFSVIFLNTLLLVCVMYIPKMIAFKKNINRAASTNKTTGMTADQKYTTNNETLFQTNTATKSFMLSKSPSSEQAQTSNVELAEKKETGSAIDNKSINQTGTASGNQKNENIELESATRLKNKPISMKIV